MQEMLSRYPGQRVIQFYVTNNPYGCFSNLAAYSITMNGKLWPTDGEGAKAKITSCKPPEEWKESGT